MKKNLLFLTTALFAFSLISFGQCVINTTYTTAGYYPATGFTPAYVTLPFSQVVQIRVLADTTVPTFGNITVNYVQMDSVKGMPTGFTYSTNPSTGKFPGGSNGCLMVMGTAVTGQEMGGPSNNGVYPLTVYYHANLQVPVVGPTNQPGTNTKYTVTILPASAGISESELEQFTVFPNVPNPADSHTDISYWLASSDNVEFRMYNVLGSLVSVRNMHGDRGNNKFMFDVSSLTPGIYLYSIKCGSKTVSKRMIVSAH